MCPCLTVDLSERSYPIFIGEGLLRRVEEWLPLDLHGRRAFIVSDEVVTPLYVEAFSQSLTYLMKDTFLKVLPVGEGTKCFSRLEEVLDWMLETGCTRQSILFAVGGGVIGDITGLAAALALRGIDFVQIPTTLLAQVDSSVGGKTGINTPQGKNLVGAFYQPKAVAIDLETISTLPLRERQAGYAEIVKYGLLGNADFYAWLEKNGRKVLDGEPEALAKAIETSCQMKAEIVQQDEREEAGLRALLNLGHSFGHALETAAGYDGRILHGEAVGIGLVLAARLSARLGKINQSDAERVKLHLSSLGMRTEIRDIVPYLLTTPEELLRLMGKDKKNTSEGLVFVLLQSIGQAALCKGVDTNLVLETLRGSI